MPALPQSSVTSSALLPSHPHPTTKDQSWRWDGDQMEAALRVGWAGLEGRRGGTLGPCVRVPSCAVPALPWLAAGREAGGDHARLAPHLEHQAGGKRATGELAGVRASQTGGVLPAALRVRVN